MSLSVPGMFFPRILKLLVTGPFSLLKLQLTYHIPGEAFYSLPFVSFKAVSEKQKENKMFKMLHSSDFFLLSP